MNAKLIQYDIQIFYPPSHSSFIYHDVVHKAGEERPPERK